MRRYLLSAAIIAGLGAPSAFADSISPSTFSTALGVGESVTIHKTVTVSEGRPTSALVDVKFIADTTGSMGGIIGGVKTTATDILNDLDGLGDLNFGASEYKDIGDSFTTRVNQALTASAAAVQTGIGAWSASGGGDTPEGNLIALKEAADAADWRSGSTRFVVQFGDAPGHEGGSYPTLAQTETALNDANVTLLVVGTEGMNSNAFFDATANQSILLSTATGGSFNVISSTPGSAIADVISDAITAAFSTYSTVSLADLGGSPGVGVDVTPTDFTGSFDRSIERTFGFDVTFTGLLPGTHSFQIGALVDGGIIALEDDRITVGGVGAVPLPAGLPLLLGAFGVGGLFLRRRRTV